MVYRGEIPVKRFVTVEHETERKAENETEGKEADNEAERKEAENEAERKEAEEQENKSSWLWNAGLTIGAVAGTALLAWGVNSLLSPDPLPVPDEKKDRKKMKQPGRKGKKMYRDDFVANPRDYFRVLHQEKKNNRK